VKKYEQNKQDSEGDEITWRAIAIVQAEKKIIAMYMD